jgi:hypothetical protein
VIQTNSNYYAANVTRILYYISRHRSLRSAAGLADFRGKFLQQPDAESVDVFATGTSAERAGA